jgi:hypothetical protein
VRVAAFLLLLAAPTSAQEARPAPDYFVEAAMATSTANALAIGCPTLSIDPALAVEVTSTAIERLRRDGFDPRALADEMRDPSAEIAALQDAFRAKHRLADGAPEDAICAAGLAEIAEGTGVGVLLVEVEVEVDG